MTLTIIKIDASASTWSATEPGAHKLAQIFYFNNPTTTGIHTNIKSSSFASRPNCRRPPEPPSMRFRTRYWLSPWCAPDVWPPSNIRHRSSHETPSIHLRIANQKAATTFNETQTPPILPENTTNRCSYARHSLFVSRMESDGWVVTSMTNNRPRIGVIPIDCRPIHTHHPVPLNAIAVHRRRLRQRDVFAPCRRCPRPSKCLSIIPARPNHHIKR